MKVLYISHDFPPFWWWQGKYMYEIVKRLNSDFYIITSKSKNRKEFFWWNVKELNFFWWNPFKFIYLSYNYYLKNIKNDIKIIHWNGIDHFLFLIFKNKNKKYITTTHNSYLQRWKAKRNNKILFFVYPFFIALEYFVLKRSDAVICVSELTKEHVNKIWITKNVYVIENGIDTENFFPHEKDKDSLNFLYVWRLEQRKKVLQTIQIFEKFVKNYSWEKKIKLYIVGTWPDEEKIKTYIQKNSLENYISFEGFQSDVKKYYDLAHCLLLLSTGEWLPLVVLEAMASWLLWIITQDASGKTKFIEESKNFSIVNDNIEDETTQEKNFIFYE